MQRMSCLFVVCTHVYSDVLMTDDLMIDDGDAEIRISDMERLEACMGHHDVMVDSG